MEVIQRFKHSLARVFDDNLETLQWKNVLDYTIIGLIVLSTVEVFLSTFDSVVAKCGHILKVIDIFTTIFFTVEVSLRIWCADILDDKYKGFWGRIRYCLSFYGFVDVVSTYSFYLAWVLPVNYSLFKSLRLVRLLRVFRLFRIFRFIKSFRLMAKAMRKCKTEMVISLQFLLIITLLLSFILYFVEHEAQPDVYENGWMSVAWAFAQYVGDPGGFADTPPITTVGQIMAFLVGVLGVAIFAIPAGLIGGAFSDVMSEEQHQEDMRECARKLHLAFERKQDRFTLFQIAPKFISVKEAQARLGLKEDEIMEVANDCSDFRVINLACTEPSELHPSDRLAIEHYPLNTPYGLKIDRGSKITIVTVSNIVDPIVGWWSYYLAMIGGFNYMSREVGETRPYKSYFNYNPEQLHDNQQVFMDDLNSMIHSDDDWVFTIQAASGQNEPELPTQFHFEYGGKRGDETYDDPNIMLHDTVSFESFYQDCARMLEANYQLYCDKQRYHNTSRSSIYARHLERSVNAIILRIAWSVTCWNARAIEIAKEVAEIMNRHLEPEVEKTIPEEMNIKDIAYDGYRD